MNKIIILVALFKTISPCQDLWYNKCLADQDCCSGFCERPESWEFGVCKLADDTSPLAVRMREIGGGAIGGSLDYVSQVFKGNLFDTFPGYIGDGLGGKELAEGRKPSGKDDKGGHILFRRKRQWDNIYNNIPNRHNLNDIQIFNAERVIPTSGLELNDYHDPSGRLALRKVQVNPNANNRVEYVRANITKNNLRKGTDTNQATRDYAKLMGNKDSRFANDDAGHIIAQNLGGPGNVNNNIYPQTALLNRGDWKGIEKIVFDEVDKKGDRLFSLKLNYDDSAGLSTRPTSVVYKIEDPNGNVVHAGDIENPLIPVGMKAKDY